MKKRILSMCIRAVLSVAAFVAVASLKGKNVYASQSYNLWVGNTQVTSDKLSGNCIGGGTWSFSVDSKYYLNLNNANITDRSSGEGANIYANLDKPLEIKFTGKNTLSGQQNAIVSQKSLNLIGYNPDDSVEAISTTGPAILIREGSLFVNVTNATFKSTAAAGSGAINVQSDIGFQNGIYYVINESNVSNSKGINSTGGTITFDNCTVSAKGKDDAVYAGKVINFANDTVQVIEPANGAIGDSKHSIVDKNNGSRSATDVVIGKPKTVSVSASPTAGGTVEGGKIYARGLKATVKATPNSGYLFENWTENGQVVSGEAEYTFTVDDNNNNDYDLTANFSKDTCTITFNANNGTDGYATQTVNKGEAATLDPNVFTYAGHSFVKWTENADGSGRSYTDRESITINKNIRLYAQWKEKTYSVTVTSTEGGSAKADKTSGKEDDTVTLSANAYKEYEFKEWKVESGSVELSDKNDAGATFKIKNEDVKIKAVFEKKDIQEEDPDDPDNPTPTPTPAPAPNSPSENAIEAFNNGYMAPDDTTALGKTGKKYILDISSDCQLTVVKGNKFFIKDIDGRAEFDNKYKKLLSISKKGKVSAKKAADDLHFSFNNKKAGKKITVYINIIEPAVENNKKLKAEAKAGETFDFSTTIPLKAEFGKVKNKNVAENLTYEGEAAIGTDGKLHIKGTAKKKGTITIPFSVYGKKFKAVIKVRP